MKIKILFDAEKNGNKFFTGWGISCLIDNKILFDTGENPVYLLYNMNLMGVKIADINTIVISHDHFDHTSGLWNLLNQNQDLDLYICPDFSQEFKNKAKNYSCKITEDDSFRKITDSIYTTGQIKGNFGFNCTSEQVLILNTEKGLTILTGCAHPGIIKIVKYIKEHIKRNIYLVMGGFHLFNESERKIEQISNELKKLNVQCIGPSHCTGSDAKNSFRKLYKENYVDIAVGQTIEV
ncbi:MAG: MBL fold metallo-hydrolase [Methanomicrobium sp.]|nr:MBL fold metallo-hydrolase [Methanomicrobium sp.]